MIVTKRGGVVYGFSRPLKGKGRRASRKPHRSPLVLSGTLTAVRLRWALTDRTEASNPNGPLRDTGTRTASRAFATRDAFLGHGEEQ
jgi:hypothetical protein